MYITHRAISLAFAAAFASQFAFTGAGAAQDAGDYPERPVRIVVATGAASSPDILARLVAAELQERTGQAMVVENRAGATGVIAMEAVHQSEADGYTVLYNSTPFAINPSMRKELPFDTFADFVPVAATGLSYGFLLVVNPDLPFDDLEGLIEYGGNNRILFGSPGIGNSLHLTGELFKLRAGFNMTHVPYKGAGAALAAIASGDIDMMFVSPPSAMPYVESGQLKAIAFTGAEVFPGTPEVPLVSDVIPDFVMRSWHGWFVPTGTPDAVVERLNAEIREATHSPELSERLLQGGYVPSKMTSEEFTSFLKKEAATWAEVVETVGIEPF